MTRSGFIALAGRPNVGKSTLVNAMVGHKVAIVSDKPQTTRRAIRGVLTVPEQYQLVLTDLPGVQRPRDALTSRMQRRVESELAEADAAMFVVNGDQGVGGPGDRFIAEALGSARMPIVIAVNKVDRLNHARTVESLQIASELGLPEAEVFPISARTGKGVPALVDYLAGLLPEGPFYFPPEDFSDQPEDVMLAELVREQVLLRTRQEVPHSVEVQIEEIEQPEAAVVVRATMWVETESQKGILIGHARAHDQGDRHRRAQGDRARAGRARPPGPLGARAPLLARRRRAPRPARDHVRLRRAAPRTPPPGRFIRLMPSDSSEGVPGGAGDGGVEVADPRRGLLAERDGEVGQRSPALEDVLRHRVRLAEAGRGEHGGAGEHHRAHRQPAVARRQPAARQCARP